MSCGKPKTFGLFIIAFSTLLSSTWAQENEVEAVRNVSSSVNQFALKLLSDTTNEAGDSLNIALSPYTIWTLLTIIAEGARKDTARQLEQVLKIPPSSNKDRFRHSYRLLSKELSNNANGVQLDISNAIFTNQEQKLNRTYQILTKQFYGVDIIPTDFQNLLGAVSTINQYIASATQNRIQNFVNIDDIIKAEILMTSTLYFKGQWKLPFNKTATRPDKFFDESGNFRGDVMMMFQTGAFPYTILNQLKAHAVELPYGDGNRLSMIVILPRKGQSVAEMLQQLSNLPFTYVLDSLQSAEQQFGEDDVQVFLPRFTINSDLNLNSVLDHMGIKDVFNSQKADLLGIFPSNYLFVSRVIQQAKIEVNEEGTVASSAAGATFQYKSPPPKFHANKDFAYFIVDKPTKTIVFAGKVSNPNSICNTCSRKNK